MLKDTITLLLQIRVSHFSVPLAGEFDLDMATPHG